MSDVKELDGFKESYERFRKEIAKVIIGQDEVVKMFLYPFLVRVIVYL